MTFEEAEEQNKTMDGPELAKFCKDFFPSVFSQREINWLFSQAEGGGDTAVVLLSLVMTAKAIGLDPRVYLRDVMLRIVHESDVAKLTPHGWREHFQAEVEAERDAALAHFAGQ